MSSNKLKVIIAGPCNFNDIYTVFIAIKNSGFDIGEVVSGGATGVDTIGEQWARENGIPITRFIPDWDNIDVDGAVVKTKYGKPYNAKAGFDRNQKMAEYADALIAIDEDTPGTSDMIIRAEKVGIKVYIHRANVQEGDDKYLFYL